MSRRNKCVTSSRRWLTARDKRGRLKVESMSLFVLIVK